MVRKKIQVQKFEFFPLTSQRWDDFETLFGPNGACAGCWCMWFLMTGKEFSAARKEGHKNAMRTLVQSGFEPGLIAYADGIPAGWVALAPRESYKRLENSKILAAVDDQLVWVISCFFIHRDYRRQGMMEKLIAAAIEYARNKKIKILEAFPLDVHEKTSSTSLFAGKASVFYQLGFEQVAMRDNRPILRKNL
jgi:GNAT superfamily N-acetyltransferase